MDHHDHQHYAYLVFIVTLSILALAALGVETIFPLDQGTRSILAYADTLICVFFFIDFLVMLRRAEDKRRYLLTWGWLDLLSSVPAISVLRWGRAARIIRIFRVLRGLRAARVLTSFILERRAQSAMLAAALVTITLVAVTSISVLHLEAGTDGSNIRTPEDAVWWAVATITTVGYGDKYPVTSEGRVIAAILMVVGVGLFGTVSGFVAAWFLAPGAKKGENDIEALRRDIAELKEVMAARRDSETL